MQSSVESPAFADDQGSYVNMEALKGKDYGKSPMKFTDYDTTPTGVQYKDLRIGTGEVVPWVATTTWPSHVRLRILHCTQVSSITIVSS